MDISTIIYLTIAGIIIIAIWIYILYSSLNDYKKEACTYRRELYNVYDSLNSLIKIYDKRQSVKGIDNIPDFISFINGKIRKKIDIQESLNSTVPEVLGSVSTLIADIETINDSLVEQYLWNKKHPAYRAAEIVRELREEKKGLIAQLKMMQYEYELLQQQVPQLTKYCSSIEDIVEDLTIEATNTNKVYDWLSSINYQGLSEQQKIQLALDRYNVSWKKSNRRIGYDYELYCGYHIKQGNIGGLRMDKPLYVIQYGIEQGFEDRGRDIIAQYSDGKVYIIQCKRWKHDKLIRENVIMQLFGSAAEYCYEHYGSSYNPISRLYNTVIPVLITTTNLSDTARNFAIKLGIKVVIFDWDLKHYPFPQIKCNINHGNRIYHMPFDDQYDRTIINEKSGEFYAFTVEEAESKYFRHAMKYYRRYDR